MNPHKPKRGGGNLVYSGSLGLRPRGQPPAFAPKGPTRAVVVAVYVAGDPAAGVASTPGASARIQTIKVEADVILARSGIKLERVPVSVAMGLRNAEPWIPAPATRTVSGAPLNLDARYGRRGEDQGPLTPLDDVDGDIVLVEFIDGDFNFPFITQPCPHQRTLRTPVDGDGWSEAATVADYRGKPNVREKYLSHSGTEFRVNAAGDVLFDTAGASTDDVTEDPSTPGGQFRVRVKGTERFTIEMDGVDVLEVYRVGDDVFIDLGEGATERLMLGDSWRAFFNDFINNVFNTHVHPTGTGPSGAPTVPATEMGEDLLSDLSRTKKS